MGHSLLARYQLADFYVGDLPMVECVNETDSNSEEESDDESDEEVESGFVKVAAPPQSASCWCSLPGFSSGILRSDSPLRNVPDLWVTHNFVVLGVP